ncbi:hypothetical protein DMENIID0001_072940 [Sergentomyia squamirostris]
MRLNNVKVVHPSELTPAAVAARKSENGKKVEEEAEVIAVTSVFFPVPITIQTGTSGSSATTGRPGDQQVTTSITFSNVSNITDMVIYLGQNISRALMTMQPSDKDLEDASEILTSLADNLMAAVTQNITNNYGNNLLRRKRQINGDALRDDILKGVGDKMNSIVNKVLTNINRPKPDPTTTTTTAAPDTTTTQTSSARRRKRDLFNQISQWTNKASNKISNLVPGVSPTQSPPSASTGIFSGLNSLVPSIGNNIPNMDTITNAINLPGDMLSYTNIFRDFANIGKEFATNMTQSISTIVQNVADYTSNIEKTQTKELEVAKGQVQDLVQQQIVKTQNAYNMVQNAMNQVGNMIADLKTEFQGSECVANFTDYRGLLSSGETCLRNKISNGTALANKIMENLSTALQIPSAFRSEITTCNAKVNIFEKFICYTKVPLKLEEEKVLLPISLARRLFETIEFFATLRADLIKCGVTTITSIGEKLANCTEEMIKILRSSPKLPHPIFLPTRKLGPTIRTPDEELTECLAEYMLVPPRDAPTPPDDEAPGIPLQF